MKLNTVFVLVWFQGFFPPGQMATIGVDFMIKTVEIDGDKVKVSFHDTVTHWPHDEVTHLCSGYCSVHHKNVFTLACKQEWTSESIYKTCIHQTIQCQQQSAGKHAHIPEQPVQPRHACSAAIHGPSKYLIIANQIQRATKTGFYWKVTIWENKWVFSCDLNEECVCGGWRKADYSRLRDPDRRKIPGLSISSWTEGSSVYVCLQ